MALACRNPACTQPFRRLIGGSGGTRYCSPECAHAGRRTVERVEKVCPHCRRGFTARVDRKSDFCSMECKRYAKARAA